MREINKILSGNMKGRNHSGDLCQDGKGIFKLILEN
jgi:hypothetical protein